MGGQRTLTTPAVAWAFHRLALGALLFGCSSSEVNRFPAAPKQTGGVDGASDGRATEDTGATCDCGVGGNTGGAPSDGGRGGRDASVDSPAAGSSGTGPVDSGQDDARSRDAGGGPPCETTALYVMVDRSASMGCAASSGTRWDALKTGLASFVRNGGFASMGFGLGYFGTAAFPPGSSCNPADYGPDVEIGRLSTNGGAILGSLIVHDPFTDTPTLPALQGGISHAIGWKAQHPGATVAVVLVTDGRPNACGTNTFAEVATVAETGRVSGGIRTYVIGIVSPGTSCAFESNQTTPNALDSLAAAGGTQKAVLVDMTAGNVADGFTGAFEKVAHSLSPSCSGTGGSGGSGGAASGGSGGAPSNACAIGEKRCGGICLRPAPGVGCSLGPTCTRCPGPPPFGAVLSCNETDHTCDFTCFAPLVKVGNRCVSNPGPEGGINDAGTNDASGTSDASGGGDADG